MTTGGTLESHDILAIFLILNAKQEHMSKHETENTNNPSYIKCKLSKTLPIIHHV